MSSRTSRMSKMVPTVIGCSFQFATEAVDRRREVRRPAPLFRPPPVVLFTVAQARFFAVFVLTPRFL